jgi:hypothetical protein
MSVELLEAYDRPIDVCPLIDVDTEQPVNAMEVVERIRQHWPDVSD